MRIIVSDQVKKLGEDKFAVFTNQVGTDHLTVRCDNGFTQVYAPKPVYIVTLPAGCKAETRAVRIDATAEISTTIDAGSISIPTIEVLVSLVNESSEALASIFDSGPISFADIDAAKEEFRANIKGTLEKVGIVAPGGSIGWTTILVVFALLAAFFALYQVYKCCKGEDTAIAAAYRAGVAAMV